jgi:hypothetical protein
MIRQDQIDRMIAIVRRGGVLVCNAATRDRLYAAAAILGVDPFPSVRFRISAHLPDGRICAISHDGASGEPFAVTAGRMP